MTDEENKPKSEDRTLAMLAHATPPAVDLLSLGMLGWLVPLIIWLVKKDDSEFVAAEARESLNLRLCLLVGFLVAHALNQTVILACIGMPIGLILWLYGLVYGIIAGISAYDGKPYRYPLVIRLIK